MEYYYQKENQKIGPLTLENLRSKNLDENTLVWYKGLQKWTPLKKLSELKNLLNQKEETKYFILENKEKKGPFYLDYFKENSLLPNTLIWNKNLKNWTPAKDIEEIENFIMPAIPNELNNKYSEEITIEQKSKVQNEEVNSIEKEKINRETNPNFDADSPKYHNTKYVDNSGGYFKRPFSAKGRIGRIDYFISHLIGFIIYFFIVFLLTYSQNDYYGYSDYNSGYELVKSILVLVVYIFFIYYVIVTTAKRCHDVGNSGWYQLIPFYALVLLFIPGQDKDNEWGTKP